MDANTRPHQANIVNNWFEQVDIERMDWAAIHVEHRHRKQNRKRMRICVYFKCQKCKNKWEIHINLFRN